MVKLGARAAKSCILQLRLPSVTRRHTAGCAVDTTLFRGFVQIYMPARDIFQHTKLVEKVIY